MALLSPLRGTNNAAVEWVNTILPACSNMSQAANRFLHFRILIDPTLSG